jgi:DNA-binding MarR family transcriptional regulator
MLVGRLRRRLREQSRLSDISPAKLSVIARLDREGPATVTTLALAEGVRPQSMGATIADLEVAGLVQGSPDPTDGRKTVLALTAACNELLRTTRAEREDWLFRSIRKLAPEEQEQLAIGIELLKRIVDSQP